jgi:hypothetical protein
MCNMHGGNDNYGVNVRNIEGKKLLMRLKVHEEIVLTL